MPIFRRFNFVEASLWLMVLLSMLGTSATTSAQRQVSGAAWIPAVTEKNYLDTQGFSVFSTTVRTIPFS